MPLLHSFGILNRTEFDYLDGSLGSSVKTHLSERVQLHDDLLHYFGDSLLWIPSFNPSRKVEQVGINFWGLTVITSAGAEKAAQVFGAWKDLFIQSPEELTLTGPFTWEERDEAGEAVQVQLLACATTKTIELPEGAHQAVLEFERDEVVNSLEKLSSACKRVAKGDGSEYLLHMGI